jgi:hypothetical protein
LRIALFGAVALAAAACETQHNCRSGTMFLQVDLGPFKNVSEVDVSVSINGMNPTTTALPIAAGAKTGGIEIDFPHGYPSGDVVTVGVEAKVANTTIALHSTTVYVTEGCETVDVGFYAGDAVTGAGGAGGSSAGAGGRGGVAGTSAGGTSGFAGIAGTSEGGTGGVAGATGGSIGGSTGGIGGSFAGRGGAGGSGGATGGTVGGIGGSQAGRGGTGGDGTGGIAGVGGRGGSGGCVPIGPENCFNGRDDDCDGYFDCGDADCGPGIAQCVPLDTNGGRIGVVVTNGTACPTGFTDVTAIYAGQLTGGACSGCSCRPPTVTACTTTISSYGAATDCANLSNPGTQELALSSTQVCTTPSWTGSMLGQVYGVQATAFTPVISGSCIASGVATPGPSSWTTSNRFCATATVGVCPIQGQVCIPATSSPKCTLWEGVHTCQIGTSPSTYYTGYTDSRTCSSCSCGSPTGQGCSAMRVNVGTDYTCSPNVTASLSSGGRFCYAGNGVYSPGVVFTGSPTQPTSCPATSSTSGGLSPTGIKTTCCM